MKRSVEIKARCRDLARVGEAIRAGGGLFRGIDHQTDTYFVVPEGRLKVREGTIENGLIAYRRPNEPGARLSTIVLAPLSPSQAPVVRSILEAAVPVLVRVVKEREIFFAGNVKLHLDRVERLGEFVEIEALGEPDDPPLPVLEAQAAEWRARLGIADSDLVAHSYSDLLL